MEEPSNTEVLLNLIFNIMGIFYLRDRLLALVEHLRKKAISRISKDKGLQ